MNNQQAILTDLREEFNRWEAILSGMRETEITEPRLAAHWSVKDIVAHLWAWQQRSIARLEAALHEREPEYPPWPTEFDPEMAGQPHQLNAWLYQTNRNKPWSQVYQDWRAGFLRFLELGEEFPESDLQDAARYAWMEGQPLISTLRASYEHHAEHRSWLPV